MAIMLIGCDVHDGVPTVDADVRECGFFDNSLTIVGIYANSDVPCDVYECEVDSAATDTFIDNLRIRLSGGEWLFVSVNADNQAVFRSISRTRQWVRLIEARVARIAKRNAFRVGFVYQDISSSQYRVGDGLSGTTRDFAETRVWPILSEGSR
jgi:hypothetical protein